MSRVLKNIFQMLLILLGATVCNVLLLPLWVPLSLVWGVVFWSWILVATTLPIGIVAVLLRKLGRHDD